MKHCDARSKVFSLALAALVGAGMAGCGDDDAAGDDTPTPDAGDTTPDAGGPDAAPGDWVPVIQANWTLAAGKEGYICASKTLTEDLYIGGYRPIAPAGTHHTVLSYGEPTGTDDPGSPCSATSENPFWIYASGVGTNELVLPDGVGVKIPAGQQIHVNLHLFNIGDQALSGLSGVEILPVNAASVVHEADMFLPGDISMKILAGSSGHVETGNCTAKYDQTLVALFPHMHQLGVHFKTEIVRGGQTIQTLWDEPYQFDSQEFALLNQVEIKAGDVIRTTCTYDNPGNLDVGFGNSSNQEMCFSILIRYPAAGGGLPICAN